MYISPDKDQYSILPVQSGDEQLLLIGGQGHIPFTRFNAKERYKKLAEYAEDNFDMEGIDYRWTAYDYLGYDDMPLVGKLYPWSKHVWTATGLMKWGMTNGTMAAMLLSDLVLGIDNKFAAAFNPHRMSAVKAIPKVIREHLTGT
jgi:glycine/D-amino acid oxidase-like deaminating enzyme